MLSDIRQDENLSIGIHPNFNPLLEGNAAHGKNAEEVVTKLLEIVPEARCVRSHSIAQSSRIHKIFTECGLTHDSNTFIPFGSKNEIIPWTDWNGLIRVPYVWEDDFYCLQDGSGQPELEPREMVMSNLRLLVFNFHPIHVFLNTESLNRYELCRPFHHNFNELKKCRFSGYGTRSRLVDLLDTVSQFNKT